jgi:hypothetical protein
MQFKNEQAKKLMNFDFQFFASGKKKTLGRLDRGSHFSKVLIDLQDIKLAKKKKKELIAEVKIEI